MSRPRLSRTAVFTGLAMRGFIRSAFCAGPGRVVLAGLSVLLVASPVRAQIPEQAGLQALREGPRIETGFERDINRYRWTARTLLSEEIGKWRATLDNRFQSDAFALFGDQLSFRDENILRWRIDRPLGTRWAAQARGRSHWYTQSRVFSQEVYSGVLFQPQRSLRIEPAAGLAWDRRPGIGDGVAESPLRMDIGPAYALGVTWSPASAAAYRIRVAGDAAYQFIDPRRGRALHMQGEAIRTLDRLRIATNVWYSNYRRDAYQAASFLNRAAENRVSETVEATAGDTLQASMNIEAPVYRSIRLTGSLDAGTNQRRIRTLGAPENAIFFDTAFNRRQVDGQIGVAYGVQNAGRFMANLSVRTGAETERRRLTNREDLPQAQVAQKANLLQQADYDQGLFALHARGRAGLGRFTVTFDGSSSILRHDTPEANLDDRDEVHHAGEMGMRVAMNRRASAEMRLLGAWYHTVYLSAARSAENNIRRSLRLRPAFTWTPGDRTRLRMGTEIRATYTVHDFTLPDRRAIDQSARELRYELDGEHRFRSGPALYADGSFSDLRLGSLLWDRFAEIPFDTLRTWSARLRLQVRTRKGVTASIGARLFIRSDFDRAATVRYDIRNEDGTRQLDAAGKPVTASIVRPGRTIIEQAGPVCSISWPMPNRSVLRLNGWLNVQNIRRRLYGALPEARADHIRQAAWSGDRKIIPNISMAASWRL